MSHRRRDAPDDDEDERIETHEGEHRVPATQYGKGNAPDENEASQTQNTQKKKKQKRAPTDDRCVEIRLSYLVGTMGLISVETAGIWKAPSCECS
jgi:hypothetical protein